MTQKEQILRHLKKRTTITPLEAFHLYGIYRLSEYVRQLREEGHNITTSMKNAPNGKRYGEYKMEQTPKETVKLPVPSAQRDHNIPDHGNHQSVIGEFNKASRFIQGGAA